MSNDTETLTLTDFLLARIAEDEEVVRREGAYCQAPAFGPFESVAVPPDEENPFYYLAVDPARVLAECEAKRQIVEQLERNVQNVPQGWLDRILQHLAAAYADHPDYREEWRP